MQADEHRPDGARHQVEVEVHRVRRQPPEQLDAPEDRIDRRDDHEPDPDQAGVDRQARAAAIRDLLEHGRLGEVGELHAAAQ